MLLCALLIAKFQHSSMLERNKSLSMSEVSSYILWYWVLTSPRDQNGGELICIVVYVPSGVLKDKEETVKTTLHSNIDFN